MNSYILAFIIIHWIGDFVLQSHWMATNKNSNNWALSAHVTIYTLTLWFFLTILSRYAQYAALVALLNGLAHWVTDYYTSRWSSKLWKQNDIHNFFVVIGLDQMIHYLTFIAIINLIGL